MYFIPAVWGPGPAASRYVIGVGSEVWGLRSKASRCVICAGSLKTGSEV